MRFHDSYTSAFQASVSSKSFAVAHLHHLSKNMNIDTLGCYKVFYSLGSQKTFHIDDQSHDCLPGDVFLISPQEWHYFSDFPDEEGHERIVCFIYPVYLKECSSVHTNLIDCFSKAELHRNHKVSLLPHEQKRFKYFIDKLSSEDNFGQDLLDRSYFVEWLVFLNQVFLQHSYEHTNTDLLSKKHSPQINDILSYINHHISEDLSTNVLADRFFLSPTYLCKLFKATTGTTLHKYVVAKRITLAKSLLTEGTSVSDTCIACGFNDYSNFIKLFTKTVGMSPKKYANFSE